MPKDELKFSRCIFHYGMLHTSQELSHCALYSSPTGSQKSSDALYVKEEFKTQ